MPFYELKRELAAQIATKLQALTGDSSITAASVEAELGTPPNVTMGHLALPCFRLAKKAGKQSNELAKELAAQINSKSVMAAPAGPYANFKWNASELFTRVLTKIDSEKQNYGKDSVGKGKVFALEYCSPNIAKKLAFHHIRSTLIGNTLAKFYQALGYQVERINFVGDWGSQFARLLAAFEMWGDKALLTGSDLSAAMNHLGEIYVRFHKDFEAHPERADKASQCLQLLEEGNKQTVELWKTIRDVSIKAMDQTLSRLGVHFDHVEGESTYIPHILPMLEEVKKKADAKLSEGAWIVEVEGLPTPALIQKKDGTTLYLTRDIAAAVDRYKRFHFEKSFYVVSEQQKLHFQLLFGVLKKMGHAWADSCEHLAFGTVLFGKEKMSTREGRVILLDDMLDEAKSRALALCSEKNPDLKNKEEVAEMVGISAVIFGELSANRNRDIEFNWEEALSFEGETGPYLQYSLVRCRSLLQKAQGQFQNESDFSVPAGVEFATEEEHLILTLSKLRSSLHQAVRENEPYLITNYLIDLAKVFNRFYYQFPVLQASDANQKRIRLQLVKATEQVLSNGLNLLGIACPNEM